MRSILRPAVVLTGLLTAGAVASMSSVETHAQGSPIVESTITRDKIINALHGPVEKDDGTEETRTFVFDQDAIDRGRQAIEDIKKAEQFENLISTESGQEQSYSEELMDNVTERLLEEKGLHIPFRTEFSSTSLCRFVYKSKIYEMSVHTFDRSEADGKYTVIQTTFSNDGGKGKPISFKDPGSANPGEAIATRILKEIAGGY